MGRTSFLLVFGMLILHLVSVIICNFNIVSITLNEPEADAPLVVDGDRMLSFSVSSEFVEPISRRNPKVIQARCQIYVLELSSRPPYYVWRQSLGPTGREQSLRVLVDETLDHASNVMCHVTFVNPTQLRCLTSSFSREGAASLSRSLALAAPPYLRRLQTLVRLPNTSLRLAHLLCEENLQ